MWTAYHALANVCSVQALVHPDASGQSDWAVAALQWENEALVSIGVGDLLATAYHEPWEVLMAALLPCFWIYWDVGNTIARKAAPDNPYRPWIDTYSDEAFGTAVRA